jgi:hypothetical protein
MPKIPETFYFFDPTRTSRNQTGKRLRRNKDALAR